MAEMSAKRRGQFIRAILSILAKEAEPLKAKVVLERLEKALPPTPYELASYEKHPNVRRFEKVARFSTIGPVKNGWIIKLDGLWSITEEGRQILDRFKDPEDLARINHELYDKWKMAQPDVEEPESEVAEAISNQEEAKESALDTIENYLAAMNPYSFQSLVASLLRAMGYHVDWESPPGRDEGLDIVAYSDPLGVKGPRLKVQVKRRRDTKVDSDELGSFLARLGDNDVGLYVSTGGFTSDAEKNARRQEKRQITLMDVRKLFNLWTEYYDKIDESGKNLLPLKRVFFLDKGD